MGLGDLADDLIGRVERAGSLFEQELRLGVTGLSGAGKTVFITALVASLLERDRMRMLRAEADGRIRAAQLAPQPDRDVPRFAFETHLAALRRGEWPESTRSVSQLRLSIRYRPEGTLSGLFGTRTLHLDIVDYPGEWLLDLPLMETGYDAWAAQALAATEAPGRARHAGPFRAALEGLDPDAPHDEATAARVAEAYAAYLRVCKAAGLSSLAPGRFLMPGDMEGSPALSFAPLPPGRSRRGTIRAEMESRFEDYKRLVVRPFFKTHFARLERQVVLVDALGALAAGPQATSDLISAMGETLACFKHGETSWLGRLLGLRRIGKLLFVASKADHLHHEQHPRLTALVEGMVAEAARRAVFSGAETGALAIAAIRATAEQEIERGGRTLAIVRGKDEEGKEKALFPGRLPQDLPELMAEGGEEAWLGPGFAKVLFTPPGWSAGGPPHIRLDRVIEFLIGKELE